MQQPKVPECAISGRSRTLDDTWFLLVESRWQDKIKIPQWHDRLGRRASFHSVAAAVHAQELVVRWMTTGSLGYPFARTRIEPQARAHRPRPGEVDDVDTRMGQQIAELAIHRESIHHILRDSHHFLTAILDALLQAFQRHKPESTTLNDEELAEVCGAGQGVV